VASSIATDIRGFIVRELQWSGSPDNLTDDYPLLDRSVLDSLDILKLVTFLEDRFSIDVDDEELVPEHFETISRIRQFVESKTDGRS
jgi:acyl carrier protein